MYIISNLMSYYNTGHFYFFPLLVTRLDLFRQNTALAVSSSFISEFMVLNIRFLLKPWTLLWLRSSPSHDYYCVMKFLLYLSREPWHYKLKKAFWLNPEMEECCKWMKNVSVEILSKMFDMNIWTSTLSAKDTIQYAWGPLKPVIIPMSA